MKKTLLRILICPACLPEEHVLTEHIVGEQKEDIIEGSLICQHCGRDYLIHDGVAFLDPACSGEKKPDSQYESSSVLSSYLWSHYGDLLKDPDASAAYAKWVKLMRSDSGLCLDVGSATGRFAFEMSKRSGFVVGIDNSLSFVRTARDLMIHRRKTFNLVDEGLLTREVNIQLPVDWDMGKVEFILGDAQALPFRKGTFSSLASLNLIDKVPSPMKHLTEMNRAARDLGAQLLFSDPFSWSREAARENEWLGGKSTGAYAGRGMENIVALLRGDKGGISPKWQIEQQGHVWWKIRTHCNHFELIRSCFVKAER
jgi:SAM-dependent methyltransferase/uncharacterized protein YbaR (Trm112 family)